MEKDVSVLQKNRKKENMTLRKKGNIKGAQGWCTSTWAVK